MKTDNIFLSTSILLLAISLFVISYLEENRFQRDTDSKITLEDLDIINKRDDSILIGIP